MVIPDTTHRRREPELMDDPALEADRHRAALRALARVNVLSGTSARIWSHIREYQGRLGGPVRVLDVACGGGDVVVSLTRRALREGVQVKIHGCDASPFAIDQAQALAERRGADTRFFQLDALASPMPEGYHIVCCSLFLHHLSEAQAVQLLRSMAAAAPSMIVQDLVRSRLGYALAYFALRLISRSEVAQTDGARSVLAAFTLGEIRALAESAGLTGARVRRCWPERAELKWSGS